MKTILLNPPFEVQVAPPLGLAQIYAVLKKYGKDVDVVDAYDWSFQQICSFVKKQQPDMVGMPCTTPARFEVLDTAFLIKKVNPDIKIVLGGPHPTLMSQQILENYPFVDLIVRNEGEYILLNLINCLEKNEKISNTKGISFREGEKVYHTPDEPFIQNLDELPFPAYHKFNLRNYVPYEDLTTDLNQLVRAPLISTRGCPYECVFCSSSDFWGHKWRFQSPKYVVDLMEYLYSRFNARYQRFFDDNFFASKKRTIEICKELVRRKLHTQIIWRCEGRPDAGDREVYKWLAEAGCHMIEFGVESGTEEGLIALNKRYTLDQIRKALRITKEVGIFRKCFFIIGGPHENSNTVAQTRNFIEEVNPDRIHTFILTVLPGTLLYERAKSENLITDDFWLKRQTYDPTTKYWNNCLPYTGELPLKEALREANRMMYWWNVEVKGLSSLFYYDTSFIKFMAKYYLKRRQFRRIWHGLSWVISTYLDKIFMRKSLWNKNPIESDFG